MKCASLRHLGETLFPNGVLDVKTAGISSSSVQRVEEVRTIIQAKKKTDSKL